MAEQESGRYQETLAQILTLPSWMVEQAVQVLEAQRRRRLSQAQYAAQQGVFRRPTVQLEIQTTPQAQDCAETIGL